MLESHNGNVGRSRETYSHFRLVNQKKDGVTGKGINF